MTRIDCPFLVEENAAFFEGELDLEDVVAVVHIADGLAKHVGRFGHLSDFKRSSEGAGDLGHSGIRRDLLHRQVGVKHNFLRSLGSVRGQDADERDEGQRRRVEMHEVDAVRHEGALGRAPLRGLGGLISQDVKQHDDGESG